MRRIDLGDLSDRAFDVVVIGGGVNGASAAHHLAAAGYDLLLVDKGDFGAGSSSRSGRLLHCGLRYMEPGDGTSYMAPSTSPVWQFARHPGQFLAGCAKARDAMDSRAQIVTTMPERVRANTFFYPIYADGKYAPWQVGLGFRLLAMLGPKAVPLDHRRVPAAEAARTPLLKWLRDPEKLRGAVAFREYRFEWPERVVIDTVLDAARLGATVRNHTEVAGLARAPGGGWEVRLADPREGATATVRAKAVVNTAGMWIDRVNRLATQGAGRKITGTKGTHLMVRLPPECRDYGLTTYFRDGIPFYVYPWRGLHYLGPTDTLFEGDEDDLHATGEEIEYLLEEANHLLPGLGLARSDILFTWAGVRPQTYDPAFPMGRRWRQLHDLAADGMPGVFALTAGNIITHRKSGAEVAAAVGRYATPSGKPRELSYRAASFPREEESSALLNHWPEARLSDLRHAARHEMPVTLTDLLFRRVGAGWTQSMAREGARRAAETVADIMGWDEARIEREVAAYLAEIKHLHGVSPES